jgi:hypothetical protein
MDVRVITTRLDGDDYTDEERAFLTAIEAYKKTQKRPWPAWTELLAIVHSLGYRKVEPAGPLPTFYKDVRGHNLKPNPQFVASAFKRRHKRPGTWDSENGEEDRSAHYDEDF